MKLYIPHSYLNTLIALHIIIGTLGVAFRNEDDDETDAYPNHNREEDPVCPKHVSPLPYDGFLISETDEKYLN